jgi:hypothetical protein
VTWLLLLLLVVLLVVLLLLLLLLLALRYQRAWHGGHRRLLRVEHCLQALLQRQHILTVAHAALRTRRLACAAAVAARHWRAVHAPAGCPAACYCCCCCCWRGICLRTAAPAGAASACCCCCCLPDSLPLCSRQLQVTGARQQRQWCDHAG